MPCFLVFIGFKYFDIKTIIFVGLPFVFMFFDNINKEMDDDYKSAYGEKPLDNINKW